MGAQRAKNQIAGKYGGTRRGWNYRKADVLESSKVQSHCRIWRVTSAANGVSESSSRLENDSMKLKQLEIIEKYYVLFFYIESGNVLWDDRFFTKKRKKERNLLFKIFLR